MGRRPGKVFEASLTVRRRPMPSNSPPEHAFLCTADCSHLRLLPVPCVFSSAGGRRSAWRRRRGDGRRRSRYRARAEPSGPRAEHLDRASESFFRRAQRCVVDACERICIRKCAYVCRACLCEDRDGSRPAGWSQGVVGVAPGPQEESDSAIWAFDVCDSVTLTMYHQLVGKKISLWRLNLGNVISKPMFRA